MVRHKIFENFDRKIFDSFCLWFHNSMLRFFLWSYFFVDVQASEKFCYPCPVYFTIYDFEIKVKCSTSWVIKTHIKTSMIHGPWIITSRFSWRSLQPSSEILHCTPVCTISFTQTTQLLRKFFPYDIDHILLKCTVIKWAQ